MTSSTGVPTRGAILATPAAISNCCIVHLAGYKLLFLFSWILRRFLSSPSFVSPGSCGRMARPKSMPDFTALIDAPTPLHGKEFPKKKPSISLAAGLIMASESPRSIPNTPQHFGQGKNGEWSENLFYAYAQKVYSPVPHPSLCPLSCSTSKRLDAS